MLAIKVHRCMLHNANTYSAATLLSDKNRQRTMVCMKKPMSRTKSKTDNKKSRDASVLIAICVNSHNNTEELSILYTKRSATLSRHSHQVSFPGGLRDSVDSDAIECALRECEEEIGLQRNLIEVWGAGGSIQNFDAAYITPVVGVVHDFNVKNLVLNTHEVEEAFTVPLKELLKPDNLHYTQFRSKYSIPVFITPLYRIWGLTAYITFNFLSCLLPPEANWHQYKYELVKYIKPYNPSNNK